MAAAPAPSADAVPPDAASDSAKPARKLLYYRNPMGLPDTSPVPKKDSMGMDYIAVYEDDEPGDAGVVKVSPARVQTLGVKTARADMRTLDAAVRAVGRIDIDERRTHEVAPRFEGWIERLYVNATGDPVRKGQALFSVYSPELLSAQKELRIAETLAAAASTADPAAREGAQRLVDAARERLRNWNMAGAGTARSASTTFVSPANGVVVEKKAVEGMRFAPGTTIFRIADLSSVWAMADIYEQDLGRIKLGETARLIVDAFPDRRFDAKIDYIYPTLNAATRTTPVRLALDNRDGLLRPGMFAHVEVATGSAAPRLTVPASAVIDSGERQVVLLVLGEGKYKPQPVTLGLRGADAVEIRDGLEAGDEVVVAANFLIDAESNLKAALSTFTAADTAAASFPVYHATGSIDAVDAASNTVSMNHEPIPALQWPAMTMDFGLASPETAKGLLPGEPVTFEFEDRGNGEFVITRFDKAGTSARKEH
ncbi:efflux RND transporter periplasmic adaptor subunit [Azoarcus sp. L1K30]|uniref:efflux RND transporter periplasmic adaptor subunit n=1 Tax=Azoarcus sp. L1K30 TaxID=2820277 RepID=UPI001B836931|nr:efflux RND transporter periplasmic adaptor subunit [Azoarcus sp. L1K30]MBR0568784.1 efflux RND transporter periplasmic adaptor subunit [Azoarcus sp. L1K30]